MIGYDIDDVIVECIPGVYRWLGVKPIFPVEIWSDPWVIDNFHRVEYDIDFWMQLRLINGPRRLSVPPDVFVTARSIPTEATEEYMKKVGYGGIPIYTVPPGTTKVNKLLELGVTHFVDDKPQTYKDLMGTGIVSVIYLADYHRTSEQFERQIFDIRDFKKFI